MLYRFCLERVRASKSGPPKQIESVLCSLRPWVNCARQTLASTLSAPCVAALILLTPCFINKRAQNWQKIRTTDLSAPKSQWFLPFAIAMPIAQPRNHSDFRDKRERAMLHCDLRVQWKVASDLQSRAEPETPSFCGISGDLAPSTRKALAIAVVRFWCAKQQTKSSQKQEERQRKKRGSSL